MIILIGTLKLRQELCCGCDIAAVTFRREVEYCCDDILVLPVISRRKRCFGAVITPIAAMMSGRELCCRCDVAAIIFRQESGYCCDDVLLLLRQ